MGLDNSKFHLMEQVVVRCSEGQVRGTVGNAAALFLEPGHLLCYRTKRAKVSSPF